MIINVVLCKINNWFACLEGGIQANPLNKLLSLAIQSLTCLLKPGSRSMTNWDPLKLLMKEIPE